MTTAEDTLHLALRALQAMEHARTTSSCTAAWALTYRRKVQPLVEHAINELNKEISNELPRTEPAPPA